MKLDVKNEERGLSFKGERERETPLACLPSVTPKRGRLTQGGGGGGGAP
jgi:hypothetical protein